MGRSSTGAGSRSRRRTNEHQRSRSDARAEADGYKFAYIFDAGRNLAILELEHESFGVRTELSFGFLAECCRTSFIEKVFNDQYDNLKFFLEAMLNND